MASIVTKYDLDLDAAWSRTLSRARRAEVPDILRWEDLTLRWDTAKADLIQRLDDDSYRPTAPSIVEVPKDGYTVRPFAALRWLDHVVYEAVVASLVPFIEQALPDSVFSSRAKIKERGNYSLPKQTFAWARFQRAAREAYDNYEEAFMLTTDVASYFEYVEIRILIEELKALPGVPRRSADLLSLLLNEFQRSSDVWGLPQGPEASGVLGNFYLLAVDKSLDHLPVTVFRFQDDIKLFADSDRVLHSALSTIIRVMRNRHLNISVIKTKILEGPEILDELEDARKDAIQYGLKISDPSAPAEVRALFDDAVDGEVNQRDVRFSVYRLQELGDAHAIPWILENLPRVPYLAELLVGYLSSHFESNPQIEEAVRSLLCDGISLYPFVDLHLVRLLGRAETVSDETLTCLKSIAFDAGREGYLREHAIRAVGRHARPGDLGLLKTAFNNSEDARLRRSLMVAITEAGGVDKGWLNTAEASDARLSATAEFLRKGAKLPDP